MNASLKKDSLFCVYRKNLYLERLVYGKNDWIILHIKLINIEIVYSLVELFTNSNNSFIIPIDFSSVNVAFFAVIKVDKDFSNSSLDLISAWALFLK